MSLKLDLPRGTRMLALMAPHLVGFSSKEFHA